MWKLLVVDSKYLLDSAVKLTFMHAIVKHIIIMIEIKNGRGFLTAKNKVFEITRVK